MKKHYMVHSIKPNGKKTSKVFNNKEKAIEYFKQLNRESATLWQSLKSPVK